MPLFYDTAVITAHVVQMVGGIVSYLDLAVTVRRDDGFTTTIRSGSNPFRGPRNVFAAGHTYTLSATVAGVTLTRTIVAVAGTRRQAVFRFRT